MSTVTKPAGCPETTDGTHFIEWVTRPAMFMNGEQVSGEERRGICAWCGEIFVEQVEAVEHLAPESCYVCGWPKDRHAGAGHAFWANAQAEKDFSKAPQGNSNTEARYVDQHRPY